MSGEAAPLLGTSSKPTDVEDPLAPPAELGTELSYHPYLRIAFLRRVYAILALQLLATCVIVGLSMLVATVRTFMLQHIHVLMWATVLPCIALLFALFSLKNRYPVNALVLALFTVFQSLFLGVVCSVYYVNGLSELVLLAAALSLVVFGALTVYTFVSKRDFSWMGGFLFGGIIMLLVFGLINVLFGFHQSFLYSLFGAVLFSGFIVYDTYQISQRCSLDDYVTACVELYMDVINLFLMILQLFGGKQSEDNTSGTATNN